MVLLLLLTLVLTTSLCADLNIITTPDGKDHPGPCAVTCAGVGTQAWVDSGYHLTRAYIAVDITKCGFMSTPIVMASVRAFRSFPNIHVREVDQWGIVVYTDEGVKAAEANDLDWKLSWVAIGHVC